jgi:hypothetical protein
MRFSAVSLTYFFIPSGVTTAVPETTTPDHFMAEFAEYFRTNTLRPPLAESSCEEIWRDHIVDRQFLYRADAHLGALQHRIQHVWRNTFNPGLDVDVSASIDELLADSWEPVAELYRASEQDRTTHTLPLIDNIQARADIDNPALIRHVRSVLRMAQASDPAYVPLYSGDMETGLPNHLSFQALSEIISGLRQVRPVVTSNIPQSDKRNFLSPLMKVVEDTIRIIPGSDEHEVGQEFRMANYWYTHPMISFPRSCRFSIDPISEIERLTDEVISSLDFCRGLLFRFVSRETRDTLMESLHELYELLEQLYFGDSVNPRADENVRLVWVDDSLRLVRNLQRIRTVFDSACASMHMYNFQAVEIHDIIYRNILWSVSQRSFEEIYTVNIADPFDAVRSFLTAAESTVNGRVYLTVDEARAFVETAQVAGLSMARVPVNGVPVSAMEPYTPPGVELSLSMAELNRLIALLDPSLVGFIADPSMENMTGGWMVDNWLGSVDGLRWLVSHLTEVGEMTTLEILARQMRDGSAEITTGIFTEFPDARDELISFWKDYSGPDSGKYIGVILSTTGLLDDLHALSSVVLQVMETVKFGELVQGIILNSHSAQLPVLTEEANERIERFLDTADIDEEVRILSLIALLPVSSDHCERLRGARAVLDAMTDHKLGTASTRFLLLNCPQFQTLAERAQTLRAYPGRFQTVYASRANILSGAMQCFGATNGPIIRPGTITVVFLGEDGIDAGGLRREWFYLVGREIVNGDNGILIETEPFSGRFIPSTIGDNNMEFVGKFVAKAIRDGHTVPIRFAKVIYRYILEGLDNVRLDLDMYTEQSPDHVRSLRWILENDELSEEWDEATQDLSFSVDVIELGVHRVHDLIVGGSEVRVSEGNKEEYVQRLIDFKMREAFRSQLESFLDGFFAVLPRGDWQNIFTPDELEIIIAGHAEVHVADLRAHTQYLSYVESDQQIEWFWEVVGDFDQTQLASLLQFNTGTPLAPVGGFARLPLKIARVGLHENPANNPLPSAHTCSNQLDLPAYTSKEELRDKLVRSLTLGSEGFGFS